MTIWRRNGLVLALVMAVAAGACWMAARAAPAEIVFWFRLFAWTFGAMCLQTLWYLFANRRTR
jgi:hypothetical protein